MGLRPWSQRPLEMTFTFKMTFPATRCAFPEENSSAIWPSLPLKDLLGPGGG